MRGVVGMGCVPGRSLKQWGGLGVFNGVGFQRVMLGALAACQPGWVYEPAIRGRRRLQPGRARRYEDVPRPPDTNHT
jgi:hypothetical protein